MQIVIDIPDEMYDWLENGFPDEDDAEKQWQIVKNGTPLPKGHGRLVDVSEYFKKEFGDAREFLDKATTIIEADKAESEEVRNDTD